MTAEESVAEHALRELGESWQRGWVGCEEYRARRRQILTDLRQSSSITIPGRNGTSAARQPVGSPGPRGMARPMKRREPGFLTVWGPLLGLVAVAVLLLLILARTVLS